MIRRFLILCPDFFKGWHHVGRNLGRKEVRGLQLVRSLHLGDGELKGALTLAQIQLLAYVYDTLRVLNSLLCNRIVPRQELIASDGGARVYLHCQLSLFCKHMLHCCRHTVEDVNFD